MNPNRAENHSTEAVPIPKTPEITSGEVVETPSAQESSPGRQAPQTTTALPIAVDPAVLAQPAASVPVVSDDAKVVQSSGTPAKEADRIEKEWVTKAKDIVAKTQDDPHAQKEAVSKVKAEYIQKRFNKVVPTDGAVSV